MNIELLHGDCLQYLSWLEDKSIDLILTDPPYGTTACKWDSVIPFEPMWKELKRIRKDNAAVVLFGSEVFTARLILSNEEMYRYSLVWEKSKTGRFAQAKNRFLNSHEDIIIFSEGRCSANSKLKMNYYPQGLVPFNKTVRDTSHKNGHRENRKQLPNYLQEWTNYPKSVLKFSSAHKTEHPTQKPIALLEYLIKTYTLEGQTVLDFTMGSGSTGVACKNLNRNFIGIERDEKYFEIAKKRVLG